MSLCKLMGFSYLKICMWFSFLHLKKVIVGEEEQMRRAACVIRKSKICWY